MKLSPFLLLVSSVCLTAQQQAPPKEGTTLPLQLIPSQPVSDTIDPNRVILQVGDIKITAKQLDALIDVYPANTQVFARGPGKEQFTGTLVRMLVLSEEARKRKLDETDKFKEQLRFSEDNLLATALNQALEQEADTSDAALRKYFEEHRCEYQTWKARHLLVRVKGSPLPVRPGEGDRTEEEALARARELRKRLVDGADFADLAKTESDDTDSGANGGDLGTVRHGQVVPSLEDALCKMNPGDLSEPVKTPFGYHIIKLESTQAKDFAELKPQLEQKYRTEAARKAVEDLIAKTKVVKDPEYYAPPAANNSESKKP